MQIMNRQEVATRFYDRLAKTTSKSDEKIIQKAVGAKNGAKVQALLKGDWTGYKSQSEADSALCWHLAFYTRDSAQIDRIFRGSPLFREKWDTPRGDSTYGTDTIRKAIDRQKPEAYHVKAVQQVEGITAAELMKKEFPEPRWAILGILPEGLNILAGKPKKGKSIFALNIALSIASGGLALGKIQVEHGAVLYLALEDTERRLKGRIEQMLTYKQRAPDGLHLFTKWPRMDEGGLELLESEMAGTLDLRLVIIDTLQKFRPPAKGKANLYGEDYDTISQIKDLADRLGACILLIHHLRKAEAADVFDTMSGTLGLTGAADGNLILEQDGGNFVLHITGRDVESDELAISLDSQSLSWQLLGKQAEVMSTEGRQKVFDALIAEGELSPKDLIEITGMKMPTVKSIIRRFLKEGTVKKGSKYGRYVYNKPPEANGPAAETGVLELEGDHV